MSEKTYTTGEKYEIKRVLDKVYEVLENTTNDVDITIGFLGVRLNAYPGSMDESTGFAITDDSAYERQFTEYDADRMIAELDVLEHFNNLEKVTDTTEDQ